MNMLGHCLTNVAEALQPKIDNWVGFEDEGWFQAEVSSFLRGQGLISYREAMYDYIDGRGMPCSLKSDAVATDGTSEDWIEMKFFHDVPASRAPSITAPTQGIPAQIATDVAKLRSAPARKGLVHWLIVFGCFADTTNSARFAAINDAGANSGLRLASNLNLPVHCVAHPSLNEFCMWAWSLP